MNIMLLMGIMILLGLSLLGVLIAQISNYENIGVLLGSVILFGLPLAVLVIWVSLSRTPGIMEEHIVSLYQESLSDGTVRYRIITPDTGEAPITVRDGKIYPKGTIVRIWKMEPYTNGIWWSNYAWRKEIILPNDRKYNDAKAKLKVFKSHLEPL